MPFCITIIVVVCFLFKGPVALKMAKLAINKGIEVSFITVFIPFVFNNWLQVLQWHSGWYIVLETSYLFLWDVSKGTYVCDMSQV